jgi:SNF2 family DNA or RNA helicase
VVLDEAQAVKNASTASAKAVRLLRGAHRLALSGTPVENHLGELWSLFEFLNPGMLGEARLLQMSGSMARNPSPEARQLLAQALRPFILRRTKQQVARELPEKTEQTIFCELEGPQRKHYEELRQHYRMSLLERTRTQGLGRSKMHVLEALLRLRQAACHPGLIDPKRVDEPSAKLDVLMEQLAEIREEGHKALVFSQFTSLLAIVRRRLDQERRPLRIPGRRHHQPAGPRGGVSERPGVRTVSDQPESRRTGIESDRRGVRVSCSIPGGIRRWKRRPSTAPTASARRGRYSPTG